MPGPIYLTSDNADRDITISLTDRMEKVKLISLPQPVLNETDLAAATSDLPEFHIPDIASAAHPSTVPFAPHSTPGSAFL